METQVMHLIQLKKKNDMNIMEMLAKQRMHKNVPVEEMRKQLEEWMILKLLYQKKISNIMRSNVPIDGKVLEFLIHNI